MKRLKNIVFYLVLIGGCIALMLLIIKAGQTNLQGGMDFTGNLSDKSQWSLFFETFRHNLSHPLATLLLQIAVIMVVARLFSWVSKMIGQPAVIGEIIAGIVLGPSLLGMYFPEFSGFLFPAASLGNLGLLSQIGLVLFMFVIGMELDLKVLRTQVHEAVVISHASIIIPFVFGLTLSYFIYNDFAPQGVPFVSFGLFLGISMSITAFPVLARIVQERGLHKTRLGTIVLTCAAADDITAWSLLAVVIAIVKAGSLLSALPTILLALVYVTVLIKFIRPFLKRIGDIHSSRENLGKPLVAIFFLVLILSSYTTEIIGIHALFGAFMAGAVMPENEKFKQIFIEKVEDVALVLLLPLFFVFTGLRTQIGLLNDPMLWRTCIFVIFVAVAGKFAGSAITARYIGQPWKDSLIIGALMNTRGLVELVALNIGYDLGILTPEIFAMLVIMALVTTFMTSPALRFINWIYSKKNQMARRQTKSLNEDRILISFGKPEMGRTLLRLANCLISRQRENTEITTLHLSPTSLFNSYKLEEFEKYAFKPVLSESEKLNRHINTLYKISDNIGSEIAATANMGNYDILLIGMGQSIFKGSLLGNLIGYSASILNPKNLIKKISGKGNNSININFAETAKEILSKCKIPVGILIDKDFKKAGKIFLPVVSKTDEFLIEYIHRFIEYGSEIIIYISRDISGNNSGIMEKFNKIGCESSDQITFTESFVAIYEYVNQVDLMIISVRGWNYLVSSESNWLAHLPSVLIVKH